MLTEAGFGARVPRGARPALVVVDLCRGFTGSDWPTGTDLTDVVVSTARLVRSARAAGVPIVLTTLAFEDAEVDGGAYAWLRKAPGLGVLRSGSAAVELDDRLPLDQHALRIVKKGASAFFGTPLAAALTSWRVDTVLVSGATTSGCVRATVVDAVQLGFDVLVPQECVGDRVVGPHEAALLDIDTKYGDVISMADALSYLSTTKPSETEGERR